MHPYRLRTTTTTTRNKINNNNNSFTASNNNNNNNNNHGPLEYAIKSDLIALIPRFEEELLKTTTVTTTTNNNNSNDNNQTKNIGQAFNAYKHVYCEAKIGILYRKITIIPNNCDLNSYTQFLYSICLSILYDIFHNNNNNNKEENNNNKQSFEFFINATFTIFTLYTLYQTNPLPLPLVPNNTQQQHETSNTTVTDWYKLLPLGMKDKSSSHRRSYKRPIRIDIQHYNYLLQLHDLSAAAASTASVAATTSSYNILNNNNNNNNNDSTNNSYLYYKRILAMDLMILLERMFTSNMFDFASYTGPCGLEAYAGHALYPYYNNNINSAVINSKSESIDVEETDEYSDTDHDSNNNDKYEFSQDIQQHLMNYLKDRNTIKLPPIHTNISLQEKRIRTILRPMFLKENELGMMIKDPISILYSKCNSYNNNINEDEKITDESEENATTYKRIKLRHRHVTFKDINNDNDDVQSHNEKESITNNSETVQLDEENEKDYDGHYELILPNNIRTEMQVGIQDAIRTIVKRDITWLASHSTNDESTTATNHDGVSTLGIGGVSTTTAESTTTTTTVSGEGRRILHSLLQKAKERKNLSGSNRNNNDNNTGYSSFLEAACPSRKSTNGRKKDDDDDDSIVSDLSSGEDNGDDDNDVSVAASRVGRKALHDLLVAAGRVPKPKSSTKAVKKTKMTKTKFKKTLSGSKKIQIKMDERERIMNDNSSVGSNSLKSGDGRRALDKLLMVSRIDNNATNQKNAKDLYEQDDNDSTASSSRLSGQDQVAISKLPKIMTNDKPKRSYNRKRKNNVQSEKNQEKTNNGEDITINNDNNSVGLYSLVSDDGRRALNNLLMLSGIEENGTKQKKTKNYSECEQDDNESTGSTSRISAEGNFAMRQLPKMTNKSKRSYDQKRKNIQSEKMQENTKGEDLTKSDDNSVGSYSLLSGDGRRALDKLLMVSRIEENGTKQKKTDTQYEQDDNESTGSSSRIPGEEIFATRQLPKITNTADKPKRSYNRKRKNVQMSNAMDNDDNKTQSSIEQQQFDREDESIDTESQFSGVGKNALKLLLSKAAVTYKDQPS